MLVINAKRFTYVISFHPCHFTAASFQDRTVLSLFWREKARAQEAQQLAHCDTVNQTAELRARARPVISHLKYLASKPRTDAENSVSKEV